MTSGKTPLKEQAINAERITRIAREISAVLPSFPVDAFIDEIIADLSQLELKARIARVSRGLHEHLAPVGERALEILLASLPPSPEAAGVTNDFGLHTYSPHSDYVARYHRTAASLDPALEALRSLTRYFSAEDAVRHFIKDFADHTLATIARWAQDSDYRVRRLASESTRPNLPWSTKICTPVDTGLSVLEQLYTDSSHFVVQSVANHLRDIAAIEPDLALATLKRWRDADQTTEKQLNFIARQALNTRLKQGWIPAYEFLGYATNAAIEVTSIRLQRNEVPIGENLAFDAAVSASESQPLQVHYIISWQGQRGKTREKVYFLRRVHAVGGQQLTLSRQHPLRETGTSRITPGAYSLAIQVNGQRSPEVYFQVV